MYTSIRSFVLISYLISSHQALSQTVVTTYVTKVQEERRSTRWTLTEWLRIKERMKLMDLWLAMFSDPKKDKFTPEVNLMYFTSAGDVTYEAIDPTQSDSGNVTGYQAKAQLWLTNIITGSTGIRTFNVDFGLEARHRFTGTYTGELSDASLNQEEIGYTNPRKVQTDYLTGNFRLFGKSIQDTALVAKIGQYHSRNTIPLLDDNNQRTLRKGLAVGAELQVYIMRWLGAEGNYMQFQPSEHGSGEWQASGQYHDYFGFIEVSFLRLMVGQYSESWAFKRSDETANANESGFLAGAKMQL